MDAVVSIGLVKCARARARERGVQQGGKFVRPFGLNETYYDSSETQLD